MRQLRTSLVLPAVAAGLAILVGIAVVVGIGSLPPTAAASTLGAGSMSGQDAPVASAAVTIQNFAFSPAIVTIKTGTTVIWTNRDQDSHTVSAMSGAFHSPTLNTGQSYQYTFTRPGRFDYLCTIHPFMTATVVVTP
jgi:plastocyanin